MINPDSEEEEEEAEENEGPRLATLNPEDLRSLINNILGPRWEGGKGGGGGGERMVGIIGVKVQGVKWQMEQILRVAQYSIQLS